jgi:hypothetical protein
MEISCACVHFLKRKFDNDNLLRLAILITTKAQIFTNRRPQISTYLCTDKIKKKEKRKKKKRKKGKKKKEKRKKKRKKEKIRKRYHFL